MRIVLLRSLGVVAIGAGFFLACSSSSNDNPPTDVDGGGFVTPPGVDSGKPPADAGADAFVPTACKVATDCTSGVCDTDKGLCVAPTCSDGVKNQNESDIDCGGSCTTKCDVSKACGVAADCKDGVCTGGKCAAPTNTDGVKNGNETGIDCGGTGNNPCADGQGCKTRDDCTSLYCKANVCTAVTPGDGVKNGNETDVDCGGVGNAPCADGKMCVVDDDCNSSVCTGGVCQVPTTGDGKKNGTETDVDCGGGTDKTCAAGLKCIAGADCTSGGCNYKNLCAAGRSCTARYGGNTCGLGGAGGAGDPNDETNWEDCCTTADINMQYSGATAAEKNAGNPIHLGKYQVTAGRMRVFLESVGYDVRSFIQSARANGQIPNVPTGNALNMSHSLMEADWDPYLPTSFDGSSDAAEIADCDQGYWDYTNQTCCKTTAPTTVAVGTCPGGTDAECANGVCSGKKCYPCPAGSNVAGAKTGDERCHYFDPNAKTCSNGGGNGGTGIYRGTYTAVKRHLGGTIFRSNDQDATGCYPGSPGTHAFRFPAGVYDFNNAATAPQQSQEVYDTKAMNCTDYLMAQAFCIWDGGRLATINEWRTASYGTGTTALTLGSHTQPYGALYTTQDGSTGQDQNPGTDATNPPWWSEIQLDPKRQFSATFTGRRFPTASDVGLRASMPYCPSPTNKDCQQYQPLFPDLGHTIEYANWRYSYEYPGLIGNDYIVFISAPGRTKGRGWKGHADMLGNVFEIESTLTFFEPGKACNVAADCPNNACPASKVCAAPAATGPTGGPAWTPRADGTIEPSVWQARATWSGNGSWEVHDYGGGGGANSLLNKYGKQGFRCAYTK